MTTLEQPVVPGARFFLAHVPGLVRYGSRPQRDLARDPGLAERFRARLREFAAAAAYPPNKVLIGQMSPDALAMTPRPWFSHGAAGNRRGPHKRDHAGGGVHRVAWRL